MALEDTKLMAGSRYGASLGSAVVEGYVSPDTIIYLLKSQLIDSAIWNHNLKRVISFLTWKLQVEECTARAKIETEHMHQRIIESLENLLTGTDARHQALKRRLDQLDYDLNQIKTQVSAPKQTGALGSLLVPRPRLLKPFKQATATATKRCTFIRSETCHRRMRPLGLWTPAANIQGAQEPCWEDVERPRAGLKSLFEPGDDDGRPQVAEISEEDERRLLLEMQRPKADAETGKNVLGSQRKSQFSIRLKESRPDGEEPRPEDSIVGDLEALEHSLRDTQQDLLWHKTLSGLLREELVQRRQETDQLRQQISDIKASSERAIQDENANWQTINTALKVYSPLSGE
jgi:hypothetical protein